MCSAHRNCVGFCLRPEATSRVFLSPIESDDQGRGAGTGAVPRGARRAGLYGRRLRARLAEGAALRLLGAVFIEEVARVARRRRGVLCADAKCTGVLPEPRGQYAVLRSEGRRHAAARQGRRGAAGLGLREGEAVFKWCAPVAAALLEPPRPGRRLGESGRRRTRGALVYGVVCVPRAIVLRCSRRKRISRVIRVVPVCPANLGELPRAKFLKGSTEKRPIRMAAAALFEERVEVIDVLAVAVSERGVSGLERATSFSANRGHSRARRRIPPEVKAMVLLKDASDSVSAVGLRKMISTTAGVSVSLRSM